MCTFFQVFGAFALFGIAVLILLSLAVLGMVACTRLWKSPAEAAQAFTTCFGRAMPVAALLVGVLSSTWLFSLLITLVHQYKQDVRPPVDKAPAGWSHRLKQAAGAVCTIFIIIMFSESELGGAFIYQPYTKPEIVAHRAGAMFAPENTMAAVEQAIAAGVDMVEIDVQQLKDGSLILLHDSSFGRTAGHNKKVWEVSYDEVKNYDAGSWFSAEYAGEPIPQLEDVLQRARGSIQVMVELKLTGHENRLVEQVIELIENHQMADQCYIGSLDLNILKKVKEIDPRIQTIYITPLIFSDRYDIDFLDAFSVETTLITREMVVAMQWQQKKVYGWTANSEETINKNLLCQVDGIVTDAPQLVEYCTRQFGKSHVLGWLLETFFY